MKTCLLIQPIKSLEIIAMVDDTLYTFVPNSMQCSSMAVYSHALHPMVMNLALNVPTRPSPTYQIGAFHVGFL